MKLVRDNIPKLNEEGKLKPRTGSSREDYSFRPVASDEEHILLLRLKLAEEVGEVLSAPSRSELISEIGDLLDVIDALCDLSGIDPREVEMAINAKAVRLGGFEKGWVLK